MVNGASQYSHKCALHQMDCAIRPKQWYDTPLVRFGRGHRRLVTYADWLVPVGKKWRGLVSLLTRVGVWGGGAFDAVHQGVFSALAKITESGSKACLIQDI